MSKDSSATAAGGTPLTTGTSDRCTLALCFSFVMTRDMRTTQVGMLAVTGCAWDTGPYHMLA